MSSATPNRGPAQPCPLSQYAAPAKPDSPVLFEALEPRAQGGVIEYLHDDGIPVGWTDEEVLRLHLFLLDDSAKLASSDTPLEEKIEILQWIFTDPDKDDLPFSFASCLKLYGNSSNPSEGILNALEVREALRPLVGRWIGKTLDGYPNWVRDAIRKNPEWVAQRLARNPQWINEAVKHRVTFGDLFA